MHQQRICRLVISAVLMLTPSAFAKILYVGTCHTPSYNTISDAVAVAVAGDTVDVCPGIYAEQVFITQQLTLQGITSSGGDRARIVVPANLAGGPTTWQFVSDPYLGEQVAPQVYVNSPATTPVKITNLTIDGTGEVGAPACQTSGRWWTTGIYAWTSVTIDEVNTIGQGQTSCGLGIYADQAIATVAPSVTIENSSVQNPSAAGIELFAPSPGLGMTVAVTGNTVEMNTTLTIITDGLVYSGVTGKISSNTVLFAAPSDSAAVFDLGTSALTISGNALICTLPPGNGLTGIWIDGGPDTVTYSDNKIVDFDYAIGSASGNGEVEATLKDNSIVNSQTAINLGCSNATLSGNTINNATYGFNQVPSGFSTTGTSFYNVNQFIDTTCP